MSSNKKQIFAKKSVKLLTFRTVSDIILLEAGDEVTDTPKCI